MLVNAFACSYAKKACTLAIDPVGHTGVPDRRAEIVGCLACCVKTIAGNVHVPVELDLHCPFGLSILCNLEIPFMPLSVHNCAYPVSAQGRFGA